MMNSLEWVAQCSGFAGLVTLLYVFMNMWMYGGDTHSIRVCEPNNLIFFTEVVVIVGLVLFVATVMAVHLMRVKLRAHKYFINDGSRPKLVGKLPLYLEVDD
jgi:hypothetical protein